MLHPPVVQILHCALAHCVTLVTKAEDEQKHAMSGSSVYLWRNPSKSHAARMSIKNSGLRDERVEGRFISKIVEQEKRSSALGTVRRSRDSDEEAVCETLLLQVRKTRDGAPVLCAYALDARD
jgi:hypothetical protein